MGGTRPWAGYRQAFDFLRMELERCDAPHGVCFQKVFSTLRAQQLPKIAADVADVMNRWHSLPTGNTCAITGLNAEAIRQVRFWCSNARKDCFNALAEATQMMDAADRADHCVRETAFQAEQDRREAERAAQCNAQRQRVAEEERRRREEQQRAAQQAEAARQQAEAARQLRERQEQERRDAINRRNQAIVDGAFRAHQQQQQILQSTAENMNRAAQDFMTQWQADREARERREEALYHLEQERLRQQRAEEEARRAHLESLPRATLDVTSNPPGARVLVDDQEQGCVTPCAVGNLVPEPHTVKVVLNGYIPGTQNVHPQPGARSPLHLELNRHSRILVTTQPPGAAIQQNGGAIGGCVTPCRIVDVLPGEHKVRVELPGYAPVTTQVTVGVDQEARVDVPLHVTPPVFRVPSATCRGKPARVSIAGITAPVLEGDAFIAPPGTHTVSISGDDCVTTTHTISVTTGQRRELWPVLRYDGKPRFGVRVRERDAPAGQKRGLFVGGGYTLVGPFGGSARHGTDLSLGFLGGTWWRWYLTTGLAMSPETRGTAWVDTRVLVRVPFVYFTWVVGGGIGYRWWSDGISHTMALPFLTGLELNPTCGLTIETVAGAEPPIGRISEGAAIFMLNLGYHPSHARGACVAKRPHPTLVLGRRVRDVGRRVLVVPCGPLERRLRALRALVHEQLVAAAERHVHLLRGGQPGHDADAEGRMAHELAHGPRALRRVGPGAGLTGGETRLQIVRRRGRLRHGRRARARARRLRLGRARRLRPVAVLLVAAEALDLRGLPVRHRHHHVPLHLAARGAPRIHLSADLHFVHDSYDILLGTSA